MNKPLITFEPRYIGMQIVDTIASRDLWHALEMDVEHAAWEAEHIVNKDDFTAGSDYIVEAEQVRLTALAALTLAGVMRFDSNQASAVAAAIRASLQPRVEPEMSSFQWQLAYGNFSRAERSYCNKRSCCGIERERTTLSLRIKNVWLMHKGILKV